MICSTFIVVVISLPDQANKMCCKFISPCRQHPLFHYLKSGSWKWKHRHQKIWLRVVYLAKGHYKLLLFINIPNQVFIFLINLVYVTYKIKWKKSILHFVTIFVAIHKKDYQHHISVIEWLLSETLSIFW